MPSFEKDISVTPEPAFDSPPLSVALKLRFTSGDNTVSENIVMVPDGGLMSVNCPDALTE